MTNTRFPHLRVVYPGRASDGRVATPFCGAGVGKVGNILFPNFCGVNSATRLSRNVTTNVTTHIWRLWRHRPPPRSRDHATLFEFLLRYTGWDWSEVILFFQAKIIWNLETWYLERTTFSVCDVIKVLNIKKIFSLYRAFDESHNLFI